MEITFYNKTGLPVVYLSEENDNSIYTWDGNAVAYIENDLIYGWRGKHLGWYFNGIIYDLFGYKVGTTKEKCVCPTAEEKEKDAKLPRYFRYLKYGLQVKPKFKRSYSAEDLIDFITQNKI